MQYLLNEQEYNRLAKADPAAYENIINDLCRDVANHMPIDQDGDLLKAKLPWTCVRDNPHHYCDHCPVKIHCRHSARRFSK